MAGDPSGYGGQPRGGYGAPAATYGSQPGPMHGYPGGGGAMQPYGQAPMPGMMGAGTKGQIRNPTTVLLLSFVTCGIYQLIWFISVCNEMSRFLGKEEPSWWKIILFANLTCGIYGLWWQIAK